jgi:hypothetical protein
LDPLSLLWLFFILASLQPARRNACERARRSSSSGCRARVEI